MLYTNNTFYSRLALVSILVTILAFSFTGEKLPYNNGLGWDGDDFFKMIQSFSDIYFNRGINAYDIQRVLPFAILHYVYVLLGIEPTYQNAVVSCCILNFICILLTVIYFFKISKKCGWNTKTETIAFAICFFNVPILKIFGYYVMLTDCPAYLLSYMAIYYFITNNKLMEVVVGVLAMVTWPILALVIWILAFFPRTRVERLSDYDKLSRVISSLVRVVYILWLPLLFYIVRAIIIYRHPERSYTEWFVYRLPINFTHASICVIATSLFYYKASEVFRLNWKNVFLEIIKKPNLFQIIVSLGSFLILYRLSKYFGGESAFSIFDEIIILQEFPSSDFLIELETHFFYLGPFVLLMIFLWKDYVLEICEEHGVGFLLVLMLSLIFISDIETRKLISFYPIFLIPLMGVINKKNLKDWVPVSFVVISLFLSFFWWEINVSGIEESFVARIDNYKAFPAQRYFMFMGPWQCREVYLFVSIIEIAVGVLIVYLHKKGTLYTK